jgi:hypothetical protein
MGRIVKPFPGIQLNHSHPMAKDLVGCWIFNEGNGERVWDLSGYANHGTMQNMEATTDWVAGTKGWALNFDGSNESIQCGTQDSLDITGNALTIFAELNTTNISTQQIIFFKGEFQAGGYYSQLFNSNLRLTTNQSGVGQETVSSANPFSADTWVTVVMTRNGSSARIFVDGIETGYDSQASHLNPDSSSDVAKIGEYNTNLYFSGKISHVMIWKRAMTEGEILLLHRNPFVMFDWDIGRFWNIAGVAISDYLENELLDHAFKTGTYTVPTNLFIALYTAAPSDTGGGTEVTGGSYVRTINNTWDAASGGVVENTSAINFIEATANWGTVLAAGIFDASVGGNLLWWGTCTSITVNTGSSITFPAGTIDASIN